MGPSYQELSVDHSLDSHICHHIQALIFRPSFIFAHKDTEIIQVPAGAIAIQSEVWYDYISTP